MTRTYLVILAVVAAGLLAACGNGPTCNSLCTSFQTNSCAGAPTGSCTTFCTAIDSLSSSGMCSSQYATYKTCAGSLNGAAVCGATTGSTSCQTEYSAFVTCLGTYCNAHTTDPNCALVTGGP